MLKRLFLLTSMIFFFVAVIAPAVYGAAGDVKWTYAIPNSGSTYFIILSSPAIGQDGTIYVGADDHNLYAINSDGSLKWKFLTDGYVSSSPAIGSYPALTIYAGSENDDLGTGTLYAIDPSTCSSTCSKKWSAALPAQIVSTPAIGSDGTVYVGCVDGTLHAINPSNGQVKWNYSTGTGTSSAWFASSPAIGQHGATLFVGGIDGNLYAINTANGSLKWKFLTNGAGYPVNGSPAIGSDGTVYVTVDDGHLYAITPGTTGAILKWSAQNTDDGSGAPVSDLACYASYLCLLSSPAVGPDGTIYVGGYSATYYATLYAINPDGSEKWHKPLTTAFNLTADAIVSSPAVAADGTVYVQTNTNGLLFAVAPDTGNILWTYPTSSSPPAGGESSPAIAPDGTVYVGTEGGAWNNGTSPSGSLVAVASASAPAVTAWPMFHHDASHTGVAIAPAKIGVFTNGYWYLDSNMSWAWDGTPTDTLGIFGVGLTGAIPVVGDWNGDGTTKIGVFMNGTWYLDVNRNWQWDGQPPDKMASFGAGLLNAVPVVGDWNGDGTTKIGIYSNGVWYLDMNGNGQWDGEAGGDKIYNFGVGLVGAVPVVGDWNGNGNTKIGVYQNGYWYLDVNGNGQWDGQPTDQLGVFGVGLTNAVPVVGDWNADGIDEIGIYQQGLWYLDKNRSWQWEGEPTDQYGVFGIGLTGAVPVPGKW
jgi:outer membrane protein assembly factor BamB